MALAAMSAFAPYRLYHVWVVVFHRHRVLGLYLPGQYEDIKRERELGGRWGLHLLAVVLYSLLLLFAYCLPSAP
ncbi:hypothetical protein ACFL6X_03640 [Candidatus Latescibacterota bacterium]